ncbi:MAG: glycolate oxidase subunit GlcD [Nitratiruptor sp.]|nr:glycolate oxidase subunit GlcD [Nitratiruptor sp.]NPA83102.1 FAD-binding protein [Campylobacterota bacterium]
MIEKRDIRALQKIVGSENVKDDRAHLLAYSYDATRERYEPELVLFPRSEEEVSQVLRYCNQHRIPVVPRGAGSGFTGGALPVKGGVVLALERHMNKIKEIDLKNMVAVVEPGVLNKELQRAVERHGLFYPPDPASQEYSTIGGNVAENAGGMRAAKYGITKDYVMALRAVLPDGSIIRAGKRTIKDVAGYNLAGILVGSEGTLAVITEITLKLIAKPRLSKTMMGIFPTVTQAMEAVYRSLAGGANPVAMEFLDQLTIRAVEEKFHKGLPTDAGAILISDIDGNVEAEIDYQIELLRHHFQENGASAIQIAKDQEEAANIWFARRNASQAITIYGSKKINEDVTVPRSELPRYLEEVYRIGERYGVKIPCFGHTGDGNVHTNVMVDGSDPAQVQRGYEAIEEIFKVTIELGGTLSGEHGIGLSKAPFMRMAFSDEELALFRRIKAAFDPNNILNPGKMGL